MSTFRIKRFGVWNDSNDTAARLLHKHPRLLSPGGLINGPLYLRALKESLKTGKNNGKEAKKLYKLSGIVGALGGSAIGAGAGALLNGKNKALGALVGAGIGGAIGSTGALSSKLAMKMQAKKIGNSVYDKERWLDNLKVVDGEMSRSEFNKKYKKKK